MITTKSCDKTINEGLLFSLPFYEAAGLITQDTAKPHHPAALHGPPSWTPIASDLGVLDFNGATNYLDSPAADTVDLDFTIGDYSIVVWTYHEFMAQSQIVLARYGTDLDGWELYFFDPTAGKPLTLRHHHASLAPDTRDGCYSLGWDNDVWWLLGISRSGLYPQHFRNGMEVEVVYEAGGLKDPDACARDLVMATRYTKNADWYKGMVWNPRIWQRKLEPWEHKAIWDSEKGLFGL